MSCRSCFPVKLKEEKKMKRRTVNAMISMSMIATMCLGCGTTIMADEAADPFGKYEDTKTKRVFICLWCEI